MKKLLFILISSIFWGSVAVNAQEQQVNNKESVQIVREEQLTPEIERGYCMCVWAYIERDNAMIELNYYGIGSAEVYVVGSDGVVHNHVFLAESELIAYVDIPKESGRYSIVVLSDRYYCVGEFMI